jgi:GntR family transcriptional repressor for pyruvate dehydrogenase complex
VLDRFDSAFDGLSCSFDAHVSWFDGRKSRTHEGAVSVDAEAAYAPPAGYRPGYELVAERILQLIAELELRPGDRMPTENELAGRMGTSRTVVREAVKILSALGRVRAHKGRGLYVADDEGMLGSSRWGGFFLPTDLDHVYMLFEFRRVQETAAARYAATRATPAELRAIEVAADLCAEGHVTEQAPLFDRGDDDFHLAIATASHNQFLVAAVREARRLQRQSNIIGLHGSVGDEDAAAAAAAVHVDRTLEDYRREIQRRVFG